MTEQISPGKVFKVMNSRPLFQHFPGFFSIRLLSIAAVALLASFPNKADAGAADGTYKIVSISNSFVQDGEPYRIPQKQLRELFFGIDGIVVVNNQLPVYQTSWFKDLENPEYRKIIKSVEISGPRKVWLKRSQDGIMRGRTDTPLTAKFAFSLIPGSKPLPFSVRVRSRAKLDGDRLVIIMPIRAGAKDKDPASEDFIVTGTIRVVAERQ